MENDAESSPAVVSPPRNGICTANSVYRSIMDNNSNYKTKNDVCVLLVNPTASSSDHSTLRRSKTPDEYAGAKKIAQSEDGRSSTFRSPLVDRRDVCGGGGGGEKAVNGCQRSPRLTPAGHDGTEVVGTVAAVGSCRTSKRVTFDRHDVGGCSVTLPPEASSLSWPSSSSPRRLAKGGMTTDAACLHSEGAGGPPVNRTSAVERCALKSPAMPKGPPSPVDSSRQDQTKTGCFGCISRKNSSKSTPAEGEVPLINRSVVVPSYGSTETPSTVDPKQRPSEVHRVTSSSPDGDASQLNATNDDVGSRTAVTSTDKDTAKPKRLIRNSNCQPVSGSAEVANSQPPTVAQTHSSVNHPSVNATTQNPASSNCVSPCATTRHSSTSISSATVIVDSSSNSSIITSINQKSCSRDLPEATRQSASISSQCSAASRNAGHNSFPSVCDSPSNIPQLIIDLQAQNFDLIQFPTYRTACKLRFVQKSTLLHLVDIWNLMVVFREHGLDAMEPFAEISLSRVIAVVSDMYSALKARLPSVAQFSIEPCINRLTDWLFSAYNACVSGRLRVLSLQVALSTLCAGHMSDKLQYIFSQLSESYGGRLHSVHLEDCLCEMLYIPSTVEETASPHLSGSLSRDCLDWCKKLSGNKLKEDWSAIPQCLLWLSILHKLPAVENIVHDVPCLVCQCQPIIGFRYECQKCQKCSLCQNCFWTGATSGGHTTDHDVKEFSFSRSATRGTHKRPRPLPSLLNLGAPNKGPCLSESSSGHLQLGLLDEYCLRKASSSTAIRGLSPCSLHLEMMSSPGGSSLSHSKRGTEATKADDEHRLIARYVERLAAVANNSLLLDADSQLRLGFDEAQEKHHLVAELEAKNREILREIQRLRLEQQQQQVAVSGGSRSDFDIFVYSSSSSAAPYSSNSATPLAVELHLLRQRRDELESRMRALQGSRRELMMQLEGLMKLLKNPLTPWSTPTDSPRSNTIAPPLTPSGGHSMVHSGSSSLNDSLAAVSSDVRHAFSYQHHQHQQQQQHLSTGGGGGGAGGAFSVHSFLRKDLFSATDSVTDAVSSLVKELNCEDSGTNENSLFERRKVSSGGLMENSSVVSLSPEKHRSKSNNNHFIPDIHQPNRSSLSSGPASLTDLEAENDGFLTAEDDDDNEEAAFRWTTDRPPLRFDVTNELYDQNPRELIQRSRHGTTDEESCHETDQESYIRTDDDDDGGNTEWEDALKRWVNR